jgi:membrane associated rhomboid family serine protease
MKKKSKLKNKGFLFYGLSGIAVGFLANIIVFHFVSMDIYNFFFTPLIKIFPSSAAVPIGFSIFGGLVGIFLRARKPKENKIAQLLSGGGLLFLIIQIIFRIID